MAQQPASRIGTEALNVLMLKTMAGCSGTCVLGYMKDWRSIISFHHQRDGAGPLDHLILEQRDLLQLDDPFVGNVVMPQSLTTWLRARHAARGA